MGKIIHTKRQCLFLMAMSFIAILTACSYESDDVYTDDTTEPYQLYDYYVDQYGNEGIVVNILESGTKKQIVISADETCLPWGPTDEQVFAVDSVYKTLLTQPSYGVAMLQTMKARGIERFPAQAWCDQKNHGEKYPRGGSWRLPSYYEIFNIFGAKGSKVSNLNSALLNIGGTPLTLDNMYWSCTEDYEGYAKINDVTTDYDSESRAIIVSPKISTYATKERWIKKNRHFVRAIKYIYYEN